MAKIMQDAKTGMSRSVLKPTVGVQFLLESQNGQTVQESLRVSQFLFGPRGRPKGGTGAARKSFIAMLSAAAVYAALSWAPDAQDGLQGQPSPSVPLPALEKAILQMPEELPQRRDVPETEPVRERMEREETAGIEPVARSWSP